jgi:hypothetical protein
MVVNSWILSFSERIKYLTDEEGITIEIWLSSGRDRTVSVDARLDTASSFCFFQPRYAELLDLDLEKGTLERIRTATGAFIAYGHEVKLTVENLEWQAMVYFAMDENFPVNVVGRLGFIDRLRIGLVDYESLLYINAYD